MNNEPHRDSSHSARLLAISDIHGHKQGMLRLLREADYSPSRDRLILLGDYIDADNPVSWSTLELVRELARQGAVVLPGNQELKLVSAHKRSSRRSGVRPSGRLAAYVKWIQSLPLTHVEAGILFVHAGVRPGIPLASQSIRDLTEIREAFHAYPVNELASLIHSDPMNHPLNRFTRIMFGHTPTFKLGAEPGEIWSDDRRIAIDTGSKHGHRLTLLDVGSGVTYSCQSGAGYSSTDFRVGTAKDRLHRP
ncbi:metallophosphoesterase [Paenibacillus sp. PL2-23]|uniref:metallophosphoesterase n=1 Tax=Paenibacillus sp. PL2-23 TaxID=2100729 RepID=UPI0030FC3AF1